MNDFFSDDSKRAIIDPKKRLIFLNGDINHTSTDNIVAHLVRMSLNNNKPIKMFINSPGGNVCNGIAIVDVMSSIHAPVFTICVGQACSMAAVILSSGAKGHRYAFPHSRMMIHQPSGGAHGQATDIQRKAQEIVKVREKLNKLLCKNTGQPYEVIDKDTDRDHFMSSEEAIDYGLIDRIIESV